MLTHLGLSLSAGLAPKTAHAETERLAGEWRVQVGPTGIRIAGCPERPCEPTEGTFVDRPREVHWAEPAGERQEPFVLEGGSRALRVAIPLAPAQSFEVLAVLPKEPPHRGLERGPSVAPVIVFAERTGWLAGPEGSRTGVALDVRSSSRGARVLVGEISEERDLCGRAALLSPKLLVGSADSAEPRAVAPAPPEFVPAEVQPLSLEERRAAPLLKSAAVTPALVHRDGMPLRLRAVSAGEAASLLSGGGTPWVPDPQGSGRGEFASFHLHRDFAVAAFDVLLPAQPGVGALGPASVQAAPPTLAWLVMDRLVFRVQFDARPGSWQRVTLPEPLRGGCAALVLGTPASPTAGPMGLLEVRAVSALAAATQQSLLQTLHGADEDAARGALAELGRRGAPALESLAETYSELEPQRQAWVAGPLRTAPCAAKVAWLQARVHQRTDGPRRSGAEPEFAGTLGEGARLKELIADLQACPEQAAAVLTTAWRQRQSTVSAGALLDLMLLAVPESALASIIDGLGSGAALDPQGVCPLPAPERALYREILGRIAGRDVASWRPAVRAALTRPSPCELDLLRGLGERVGELLPESATSLSRLAGSGEFDVRYRLLDVASAFGPSVAPAASLLIGAASDADPLLREHAVRLLPLPQAEAEVLRATADPSMRVRLAAVERLPESLTPRAVQALRERAERDRWPWVRAAAVSGLAAAPRSFTALVRALRDGSAVVRESAARASGLVLGGELTPLLLAHLESPDETPEVRVAAAAALGRRCELGAAGALQRLSLGLIRPTSRKDDLVVGQAALSALLRLNPPDLATRLAPLSTAPQAAVRQVVARALAQSLRAPCQPGAAP